MDHSSDTEEVLFSSRSFAKRKSYDSSESLVSDYAPSPKLTDFPNHDEDCDEEPQNELNSSVGLTKWSMSEDEIIRSGVGKHSVGNKIDWEAIAKELPTRTVGAIRVRWFRSVRDNSAEKLHPNGDDKIRIVPNYRRHLHRHAGKPVFERRSALPSTTAHTKVSHGARSQSREKHFLVLFHKSNPEFSKVPSPLKRTIHVYAFAGIQGTMERSPARVASLPPWNPTELYQSWQNCIANTAGWSPSPSQGYFWPSYGSHQFYPYPPPYAPFGQCSGLYPTEESNCGHLSGCSEPSSRARGNRWRE